MSKNVDAAAPTPTQAPTHPAADSPLVVLPRGERPKPVSGLFPIRRHERLTTRYLSIVFEAPVIAQSVQPGQFVMITIAKRGESAPVLPRPMAVYAADPAHGTVEILYATVGAGTDRLSHYEAGTELYVVGPLGRSFDLAPGAEHVLLLGRGIGSCSLTSVAQYASLNGIECTAVSSARDAPGVIGARLYKRAGTRLYGVTDESGSSNVRHLEQVLVQDLDGRHPDHIFTCGSRRLARLAERLGERWSALVQISIEAHMACGLGYCHGCASGARSVGDESPLVCVDGPVFGVDLKGAGHVE